MIDAYYWGTIAGESPEAPVPVVSVTKTEKRLGGAANVALNIQALGGKTILCGVIGKDENGNVFSELIEKRKLDARGIMQTQDRPTTIKTRVIGDNQHLVRVDEEVTKDLNFEQESSLFLRISELVESNSIDVIVFEDYNKGTLTKGVIEQVMQLAQTNEIPVVVDPKKNNFNAYNGATLFKPNLKEVKAGVDQALDPADKDTFAATIDKFRKNNLLKQVLVTLSEHGAFICSDSGHKFIPAHARTILDVSGAGDTVVSIAALCIAQELDPITTAILANMAGGLVCEKVGVVPIDREEFFHQCTQLNL